MDYLYSYLIGNLVLLVFWVILFLWRKDIRKEMLLISLIFGFVGLIVDPIYSSDWWSPLTITNTLPGIESFIFGFTVAGIASIIYTEVFRKKIRIKKSIEKIRVKRNINFGLLGILGMGIFLGSFFLLKLNSFNASLPAFLVIILIIWIKRRDLIVNSVASAILLTLVSFAFYLFPELISPGWINQTWNFHILRGTLIVPIEDLIWFFLAGAFIGPLYEYWKEGKLINIKK